MSTFKQKNVIKSYKLRLQEKLKTVAEETDNATTFLNNCVEEFRQRVQRILEIKDEKCLSLYRNLNRDLENYSEKLFILQTSFGEVTEDESGSSEDEEVAAQLPKTQRKAASSHSSQSEKFSQVFSSPEECVKLQSQENVHPHKYDENTNLEIYPEENVIVQSYCEKKITEQMCSDRNFDIYQDEDAGNITEDDFYSLHGDNAQNTNSCISFSSQLHGAHGALVSENKCISNISFSQSSYRSISSNIGESLPSYKECKNNVIEAYTVETKSETALESLQIPLEILPPSFEVDSMFSGNLTFVTDPSSFWIQIENTQGYKISFSESESSEHIPLSSIKKGTYCLAPLNSTPFYFRALLLSDGKSGKDLVKVFFIDHGSTKDISVCNFRSLPKSAYEISAQAVHCSLHGIKPVGSSWSPECIKRFCDFKEFCLETTVKCKGNLYEVELIAKVSADLDEDFSADIAYALCLDNFAIFLNDSQLLGHSQHYESQYSKPVYNLTDSSTEISGSYDINAISNDSGVSITSALSSQISNKRNEIFLKASEDYVPSIAVKHGKNMLDLKRDLQKNDLILFESSDALNNFQNSNEVLKPTASSSSHGLYPCMMTETNLYLRVPSPSLLFVEKDMVIVMLSHIVNPHEFYVNMAMEGIDTFDDLREQMTCTYESRKSFQTLNINDLREGMFCAGHFKDDHWYRVKIIQISQEHKKKNQVLGHYIDYGNTAVIQCCDLQPLTPEFSQYPSFAIKCTLAGVNPIGGVQTNDHSSHWDENAINVFKKLISFERCLTAQICNELVNSQINSYPVLLWDTVDSKDLLINAALAEYKVAVFDFSLSKLLSTNQKQDKKPQTDIDSWDPMVEEYYDSQNTYALDDENIEIMTTGYQAKDDQYTCKYFALRGYCPRGSNCRYDHLPMLESGVTRDQEEVYCLDTIPIVSESVNNILVQVSAIITPAQFYVVLPFGCKIVDDIDNLVYKGSSYNEIINSEAKALFSAVHEHYSKSSFNENTAIALSCGTIVAAKRNWDEKWHRGRVVDVIDINKPAKVFFVDSGDYEWVPRKFIRTILPQFLHTPFQAIQCSLHGIEPVGSEKSQWSPEAVNYFKDIVAGQVLLAEIVQRLGQVFHMFLRKTSQNDHSSIAELLVSAGYAQNHRIIPSNKKEYIYVPG